MMTEIRKVSQAFYKLSQIQFAAASETQSNGFMAEFVNTDPLFVEKGWVPYHFYFGSFFGTITTTNIPADREVVGFDICFDPLGSLLHIHLELDKGEVLKIGLLGCTDGAHRVYKKISGRLLGFGAISEHEPADLNSPMTIRKLQYYEHVNECVSTSFTIPMGNKDATTPVERIYQRTDTMGKISLSPLTHTYSTVFPLKTCTYDVTWSPPYYLTLSTNKLELQYETGDFYGIGTTTYQVKVQPTSQAGFVTDYATEYLYFGYRENFWPLPATYKKEIIMAPTSCLYDGTLSPPIVKNFAVSRCADQTKCYFDAIKFTLNNGSADCSIQSGISTANFSENFNLDSNSFNKFVIKGFRNQSDGLFQIRYFAQNLNKIGDPATIPGTTDYTHTFQLTETQSFCGIQSYNEIATGELKLFDVIVCTPSNRYATKFTFKLKIEACGATCKSFSATNEIISQIEPTLMIMNGNEPKSANLWDKILNTSFDSVDTNLNPYITIDFMASVSVEAVYIHTNESIMVPTSGKFIVFVGDVAQYNNMALACPNMSGVGINSVGGVFNCGRQGRYFMIYCVSQCKMSLAMVRVWQSKAISQNGTVTIHKTFQAGYTTLQNLTYLTQNGSYSCSSRETAINIERILGNTSDKPYVQINLGYNAKITQFMAITWQEETDTNLYVRSLPMSSSVKKTDTQNCYAYNTGSTNRQGFTNAACSASGQYVAYWRENNDYMSLCKLIILGTFCHEDPLTFAQGVVWPTLNVTSANSQVSATLPVPDQGCVNISQKGYTITFAVGSSKQSVTWLTYDSASNEIKALLSTTDFDLWQGRTEQVQVTVSRTIAGSSPLTFTPMQIVFAGKVNPCGASCPAFDKTAEVMSQMQTDLILTQPEVLNSSYLNDQDPKTTYLTDALATSPTITIDFKGTVKVEAVLIYTDETIQSSGSFQTAVVVPNQGEQFCPNMGGVGITNSIGGVFNCGIEGTHFLLFGKQCRFAIKMLYIWQLPSLAHESTIQFGQGNIFATGYTTNTDLNKLIGLGSYGCINRTTEVSINRGTGNVGGLQIDLGHMAQIDQVLYLSSTQYKGARIAATSTYKSINVMSHSQPYICWFYGNPNDNNKGLVTTKCQVTGRYVALYQTTTLVDKEFMVCKVIVIGKFCHHIPLTFATEFQWPVIQILSPNVPVFFTPPIPQAGCVQTSDLHYTLTFKDLNGGDLPQVTYDYDKNQLQILLNTAEYLKVNGKLFEARGTYQRVLPGSPPFTFNCKFDFLNVIDQYCKTSTLLPHETKLPDFTISVNQQSLQTFTLPEIKDQASIDTGDSTGLVNCGPRVYSFVGDQQFLYIPNPLKPLEIVVASNTTKNVGFHGDVAVSVTLLNYPQVAALLMPFTVRIKQCVVLGIVPQSQVLKPSALYQVTELPYAIKFTRYITVPDCFYASSDFEYKITLADGNLLPQWASFDQSGPLLELYLDKSATDQAIEFMYSTYLAKIETSISSRFTLQLKTGNIVKPALTPTSEIKEKPISETFETPNSETQEAEKLDEEKKSNSVTQSEKEKLSMADIIQQKALQKDSETAQTQQPVWQISDSVDQNTIKAIYSVPIKEYVSYLRATSNVDSSWTGWTELLNAKQNKQKKAPNQIAIAPTARISEINSQGRIEIKFSKPMLMLKDLSMLFTLGDGRKLQAQKSHEMNAQMIPGFYSDAKNLQFNYTAEFKDNQTLHIQMFFEAAEYVSSQFYEDRVMVKLSSLLLDAEDGLPLLPESRKLEKPVPPQMVLGASATAVQVFTTSIQVAATTAVAGNAALNIFLQGSLNQLWGMINNIQMIVVTPLLNIQFPGNALNLYTVMIQIATFDILPTDKFYPKIFPLPDSDQAFNDRFSNLGFGSTYFAGNFGSALLGIFWMFFVYLTYPLVCYLAPSARFIEKYRRGLKKQLFWNSAILFLQEAYLDILICVLVNIRAIKHPWITWTIGLSAFLTVVLLASSIFLPLFILFYLRRNFAQLGKPAMKERFESAYEMINLEQGPNAILWAVLFFFRRAILAFTVVFSENSAIHLMAFVYPAVMAVIWLGQYHPLATPFENKLELYDACSVVLISYCLFLFTDFVPDASMRYKIGWVMLLFTLQNIVVNLYLISKQPILNLINKAKQGIQNRKILKSKMTLDSIGKKSVEFLKSKTQHWKKRIFEEDSPLETISEVSEKDNSILDSSVDDEEQKAIQLVYLGIKINKKRDDIISDSEDSSSEKTSNQVIAKKTKSQQSQLSQTLEPESVLKTQRKQKRAVKEKQHKKLCKKDQFDNSIESDSRKIRRHQRRASQAKLLIRQKHPESLQLVPYQKQFESQADGLRDMTDYYRQTVKNLKEKAARISLQAKQREQRLRTSKLLQTGTQLRDSIDDEVDFLPKHDSVTRYLIELEENGQSFRTNIAGEALYESQMGAREQPKKKKVYVPSVHQQKQEEHLKFQRTQLLQNWQKSSAKTLEMPAYKPNYTTKTKEDKKLLWQKYLQETQPARVEGRKKDNEIQNKTALTPDLEIEIAASMIMIHQRRGLKKEFLEPEF